MPSYTVATFYSYLRKTIWNINYLLDTKPSKVNKSMSSQRHIINVVVSSQIKIKHVEWI